MVSNLYDPDLDVVALLKPLAEGGQREYTRIMQALIQHVAPETLADIRRDDSRVILEPFLFAYFASPKRDDEATLEQLLAVSLNNKETRPVVVVTNSNGVAFLPGLGYIDANRPSARIVVSIPAELQENVNKAAAREICGDYALPLYASSSVELLRQYVPLLDQFFAEHATEVAPTIATTAETMYGRLASAFASLADTWPEYYRALELVLRRVVLFRSDFFNSFAHTAAHGTIFMNVSLGHTETFFIEDIVHQAGHVLLAAATIDSPSLFCVDPAEPIAAFTGISAERRTVSVAVHGLVTEALMSLVLARCMENGLLPSEQSLELTGRCAFIFKRFTSDLTTVGRLPIFNSIGTQLVRILFAIWERIARKYGDAFDRLDMSNQAYNFSLERFISLNYIAASVEPHERASD